MNSTEKAEMLSKNGYTEIINDEYGIVTYDWFSPSGNRIASEANKAESAISAYRRAKRYLAEDTEPTPQLVVVPDVLAEKNSHIAKLEADLAAAQDIIVQAGATVEKKSRSLLDALEANVTLRKENEALQAENARIIGLVMNAISDIENDSPTFALSILDKIVKTASTEAPNAVQAVTLRQPFPKYQIGQTISVCHNYGDGAYAYKPAKVVEIKQEDGANHYRVHYLNALLEGTEFWEEYQLAQS